MALPASDPFDDAIDVLGAGWTVELGTPRCTGSGQLRGSAGENVARWTADAFADDHYSETALDTTLAYAGPATRLNGDPDGYVFYASTVGSFIQRFDNGTRTNLQTLGASGAGTFLAKLESVGSTHKAYLDGGQMGSNQSDATYASGSAGVSLIDGTARLNSWVGDNVGAAQPTMRSWIRLSEPVRVSPIPVAYQ